MQTDESVKISEQELNRLNGTAQIKASRLLNSEQYERVDVHSLIREDLPNMAEPLAFEHRVELFFYLRLLDAEKKLVLQQSPCEWQDKRLTQIAEKQAEIKHRLGMGGHDIPKGRETKRAAVKHDDDGTAREEEPWLKQNPNDPNPKLRWYVPARYFARQLVKDDSTLLLKRNLLAAKVAQSLEKVGIKKRGDKKPFQPSTILKAFNNVNFR